MALKRIRHIFSKLSACKWLIIINTCTCTCLLTSRSVRTRRCVVIENVQCYSATRQFWRQHSHINTSSNDGDRSSIDCSTDKKQKFEKCGRKLFVVHLKGLQDNARKSILMVIVISTAAKQSTQTKQKSKPRVSSPKIFKQRFTNKIFDFCNEITLRNAVGFYMALHTSNLTIARSLYTHVSCTMR